MTAVSELLNEVALATKAIKAAPGQQVFAGAAKLQLRALASGYFERVRPHASAALPDCSEMDSTFEYLHSASHKNPSKQRVLEFLKKAKAELVRCEGAAIVKSSNSRHSHSTPADDLIVSSLNEICPSAALAYQQALIDLSADDRLSWRGPATDLREALRETLDVLAPDADVKAAPGFKLEGEAKRPTMKQKVRFVLKSRDVPSGAMATPEHAVTGIEEIVGGLTRSVYDRSSISTHTATGKAEVSRVLAWTRIVFGELLEIPL